MATDKGKTTTTIRFPDDLLARIDKLAKEKDRNRSYTVCQLVATGLDVVEKQEKLKAEKLKAQESNKQ